MVSNLDKYKSDLASLIRLADTMEMDLIFSIQEARGKLAPISKKDGLRL
jgi:hypothetical protein